MVPNFPIRNENADVGDKLNTIRFLYMINTLYIFIILIEHWINMIAFFSKRKWSCILNIAFKFILGIKIEKEHEITKYMCYNYLNE